MNHKHDSSHPFNSALEAGLRSVSLLVAAHPYSYSFDLQRLVTFDHLVVHTEDVGGPTSLHAAVPRRTAELLVQREVIKRGLLLMVSKGLVDRKADKCGILYEASEFAEIFLSSLKSKYICELVKRAEWVIFEFGSLTESDLNDRIGKHFEKWTEQFQTPQESIGGDK